MAKERANKQLQMACDLLEHYHLSVLPASTDVNTVLLVLSARRAGVRHPCFLRGCFFLIEHTGTPHDEVTRFSGDGGRPDIIILSGDPDKWKERLREFLEPAFRKV